MVQVPYQILSANNFTIDRSKPNAPLHNTELEIFITILSVI